MADVTKTVEILFQAQNQTGATFTSVGKSLSQLSYNATKAAAPFASLSAGILKVNAAIAALAAGGIAYSIVKFAEFEDIMLKVQGIMNASDDDYERLTALTRELGATTRYTAVEAAQGLEFLALAGKTVDESIGALPQILKLAQASTTDVGETANIVTNILATFGLGIKDLASVSDILVAGFTNSKTNLTDLGKAFEYVGPVAKQMGFSVSESTAIIGKFADVGIIGQRAGTALRNIMLTMVAPTTDMSKVMKKLGIDTTELGIDFSASKNALKDLGVEVKDSAGNLRSMPEILDDLSAGLLTIQDPADRSAALIKIFGKRGGPELAALLSQGGSSIKDLEDKIDSLGGITDKIAEKMESEMGGALRSLNSALADLPIAIGKSLSDGAQEGVNGITEIFRAIVGSMESGEFDKIIDIINDLGDEMGETFKSIAENLPEALAGVDFGVFTANLRELARAFNGLFDGVDISTPDGLAKAIQKIVDVSGDFIKVSEGIVSVLIDALKYVADLADSYSDMTADQKKLAGQFLGFTTVVTAIGGALGTLAAVITGIGGTISTLTPIVAVITTKLGLFASSMTGLGATIAGLAAGPLVLLSAGFGAIIGDMLRAFPIVDELAQKFLGLVANAQGLKSISDMSEENADKVEKAQAAMTAFREESKKLKDSEPEKSFADISAEADGSTVQLDELNKELKKLGVLKNPKVDVEVDVEKGEEYEWISYWRDGKEISIQVKAEPEKKSLEDTTKTFEELIESLPDDKRLKIEVDMQKAKLKAETDRIQTFFEFKASVDIERIKAEASVIKSLADSTARSFEDTGAAISSLFGDLTGAETNKARFALERQIDKENERRDKVLEMQEKINNAKIAEMEARTKRLESDKALITVNGDGLKPHLEMIMFDLFEAIQIYGSEEGIDMLTSMKES